MPRFLPVVQEGASPLRLTCLTPAAVHEGRGEAILARRHQTMQAAYAAHPARFPNGPPRRSTLPGAVWTNPPEDRTQVELCLANAREVSLPGLEASGGEIALGSRIGEGAAQRDATRLTRRAQRACP